MALMMREGWQPPSLCYIRSGQDFSQCGPDQRRTYLEDIQPVLKNGMDFLRDNPEETGCCTLRFSNLVDQSKPENERTFGLGIFLSLGDLEDWSSTHVTHLMIFARWQQMYRKYDHKLELRTWHEVGIIRSENAGFIYFNCHPGTGLLPFFSVEEFGATELERSMA